jgi:hypothetical protein
LIATLAQKWRFRIVPGHRVELQPLITLRPKHGIWMAATRRTPALEPEAATRRPAARA